MANKTPQQMTILIVEDQPDMLESMKTMLEMIGYNKVYGAPNGRMAWKFLSRGDKSVDLILAAYDMPDMNGMELLAEVRKNKKYRDIPFLMMTAKVDRSLVAEAAEYDVDGYLTKPVVTSALEQKINEVIKKQHHPDPMTAHLRLARDLEETGDIESAMKALGRAIKVNPGSSRPLRELGRLYTQQKKIEMAITCFQKAVQLNFLDVGSHHYLGQLYLRKGKVDDAISCFDRAIEISPRHADRALKLAYLFLRKGRLNEGERILTLILKNNPDNMALHEEIAQAAQENNFNAMAMKCYRFILKKNPKRLDIHKKVGILFHEKGHHKDAARHLVKAAEKFGEDLDLILALSRSFLAMDRVSSADQWIKKARELYPDNRDVKKLLLQS